MKNLMRSNIYDVNETIVIVGSCLKNMQPEGYKKVEKISKNIYELCLEETHVNMAITKVGGMLRTGKIKKLVFATVDKSPHCIQVHYIRNELEKMMDLSNIEIINYVVVDNELVEIDEETLIRECKEELTIDIIDDSIKYYGTFEAQAHGKTEGILVRMTCFMADFKGELIPSSEIQEIRWLDYNNLDIISPVDKLIFKDLYDKGMINV